MSSSSEEESKVKEPGRLTALRMRRAKARRRQQYLNAQSFLKKTSEEFEQSLQDDKSDFSDNDVERKQLSSYEKEAEEFLEKAMNFENSEDEDKVLVLDGRQTDFEDEEQLNSSLHERNVTHSSEDDASSIEKTKAELERYSLAFGEFLSQELENNDVDSEEDKDLNDYESGFSTGDGIENSDEELLDSEKSEEDKALSKNGQDESKLTDKNKNRASVRRTKSGLKLVSHLNTVQKAIRSNRNLNESFIFKELLNSYDLIRLMVEETEDTLDFLEKENSSTKSMLKFYENKYKASQGEINDSQESEKRKDFKDLEFELEISKIEVDEANRRSQTLERKLISAKRELNLQEQRLTAQQDMYEFDAKEMRERIARLEQNLYYEKSRSNDLLSQLSIVREGESI